MPAKADYARETRRLVLDVLEHQDGPVSFDALAQLVPSRTRREVRTALNMLCRDGGSVCAVGSTRNGGTLTFDLWVRVAARMREKAATQTSARTAGSRPSNRGAVIA